MSSLEKKSLTTAHRELKKMTYNELHITARLAIELLLKEEPYKVRREPEGVALDCYQRAKAILRAVAVATTKDE